MIKIAFFTSTRGDLASLNPIIKEVERKKGFKPLLFVGGTHLYKNYGHTIKEIQKEKLKVSGYYKYKIVGNTRSQLLKS